MYLKFRMAIILPFILLFLTSPATSLGETQKDKPIENIDVSFLHINDTHGRLMPYSFNKKSVGGYARLATLITDIRNSSKAQRVFLIHAGDILSRGDALTRKTLGGANIELLNHLKFDFWTPGNGDFYDGLKVLADRITQAKFITLTTNVKATKTTAQLHPIDETVKMDPTIKALIANMSKENWKPEIPAEKPNDRTPVSPERK